MEPSQHIWVIDYASETVRRRKRIFSYYVARTHDAVLMAIILIVEDEVFTRQTAEWTIGDLGHTALAARDLAGALLHLSTSDEIDALFVDIRLDKLALGGYDVANQAIALRPG